MSSFRNQIENLESRQLMTAIKGTDVLILSNADKTKDNGNDVVVFFDKGIRTADKSKFRFFGYSNNTIDGGQIKTTINVLSATVSGSTVVLRTNVQVRKGAQINISSGGVVDTANANVTGSVKLTKGLNRDRFTLALRAFRPNDKTRFSSVNISGGATPITANTEPSSSSVLTAFTSFLGKKVTAGTITSAQRDATLARFNDNTVKTKVPSANLRAAILSLVGTVGEPAIAFYLDKANTTGKDLSQIAIDGSTFSGALPVAETKYTSTGKLKFSLNPNYAGESFVALSGRMAHEAVHEGLEKFDGDNTARQIDSQDEEVIANFIETTVYAQQVVTDTTYTRAKTTYTLQSNYRLLVLLNSGDRQFPRVGLLTAPLLNTSGAAPGFTTPYDQTPSTPVANFDRDARDEIADRGVADKRVGTQLFPTGRAILANITGDVYTSATLMDDALISAVDIGQDTIGDRFAMSAARAIQVLV